MIKRYISLTDEDADNSYREALGLGIKKKDMAINPIARRCSKCGKLIESGDYCQQCAEIQRLTEANTKALMNNETMNAEMDKQKVDYETMKKEFEEKLTRLEKVVKVIGKVAMEDPSLLPAMKDFMND